jgi:RNA polymerase sigma factor (sigma-70 family)
MSQSNTTITLGKQMGMLFDLGAIGAMPDRDLLHLFVSGGETSETAFATLVERHGPMVLRVCHQVLADGHLAEDAFQVSFLLLARKARSIHNPDALPVWLHHAAWRVALRARRGFRRRTEREGPQGSDVAVEAIDPIERDELCALVHEEIDRLIAAQRLPILLCAFEGLSHEEAAHRLGWPLGTVKSRLVRGRRRLQDRLARRGVGPALALVAAFDEIPTSAPPVPLVLAMATTRAAVQTSLATTAAPLSPSVAMLLQRELSAMILAKINLAAGAALVGAAAILIGISLAGPLFGRGQELLPVGEKAQRAQAKPRVVPAKGRANTVRIDRATPLNPAPIPVRQDPAPVPVPRIKNEIAAAPERRLSGFGKQVLRAIHDGAEFLKSKQRSDGSWSDVEADAKTGVTSLVVLALLASGERSDSTSIRSALEVLRSFGPNQLNSTYAVSLQTMAFSAAEPERDRLRIEANVQWLERTQLKPGDPQPWSGSWTYSDSSSRRPGDNSNSQYALLGLQAASDVGVPVESAVWELARAYWERAQQKDGSWSYTPDSKMATASMTCAGISSLVTSRLRRGRILGLEVLENDTIHNCGVRAVDTKVQRGIDWLANHFRVDQNFGTGKQWQFYYLYGLERAGRLAGVRFLGERDWYGLGAQELLERQVKESGCWQGSLVESDAVLATSFALLFLAKGRAPVLINKLHHGTTRDWDNDPDDVANLVAIVSRDWKSPLTWQTVDSTKATVLDLLRAPILFINGHQSPEFTRPERENLRTYVNEGGVIFAEACCGSAEFDQGFRTLMKEMFSERDQQLETLPHDHPIWRARFRITPETHPILAILRSGRPAVIYSPKDLSCFWYQSERFPGNPAVKHAVEVGQNVIDYVTTRKLPPDKLSN